MTPSLRPSGEFVKFQPHYRLRASSSKSRLSFQPLQVSSAAVAGGYEDLPVEVENAFWDWAEASGVKASDRLRLAKFDGVVGLRVAGREETRSGELGGGGLRPGDVVLEIPKESIVSMDTFKETELGKKLGPEQIRLISSKVQIALVLLQALGSGSSEKGGDMEGLLPWIQLVRGSEKPRPCKWSMQEIERTQNPKLMTLFGALKSLRRSQLERVQPLVKGIGGLQITESDFDWAMTEVDRRSILLPPEKKPKEDRRQKQQPTASSASNSMHIVAPVLDFLQPDPLASCHLQLDDGNVKIVATEQVTSGKRVQFRPPPPGIPNEVFLTSHGYIPEINTNDFVTLRGICTDVEWRELLKKVEASDPTATNKFQLIKIFHDDSYSISAFNLPQRLLLALRILHLNPQLPKQNMPFEELKEIVQEDKTIFFSAQNEV